jgi:subtilisin-like proprotein convertase family protein
VKIAHTAVGNLRVSLVAPDGTRYVLHRRTGGGTNNLNRSYVLDLSKERVSGTWRLLVNDNRRQDHGRLTSWTLAF